jgi:hypothetical protein
MRSRWGGGGSPAISLSDAFWSPSRCATRGLCKQERQQCIIRRDEKRRFSAVDMLVSGYFVAWLQSLVKPPIFKTTEPSISTGNLNRLSLLPSLANN